MNAYTICIETDRALVQIVDTALAAAATRAGSHLACYAGCAVCCFAPFPITQRDATRLRQGLTTADPALAATITARAHYARQALAQAFPGNPTTGALAPDFDELAFAAHFPNLACPALDPTSGACQLYEARPIACRLNGLPTRVDGLDAPHCPLCFRHATANEIEHARAVINIPADLSDQMSDHESSAPRTVIAYALLLS